MTRIIDNSDLILEQVLQEVLPTAKMLDVCVGYFNIRGYNKLADHLSNIRTTTTEAHTVAPVRILVGMALAGERELQADFDAITMASLGLAQDLPGARQAAKAQVSKFAKQLIWGAPTEPDRHSLRQLLSDLKTKTVQIKIFTERPLHAKLYLARTDSALNPGRAIVGSSNFTPSGLGRNGELNLEETDHQKVSELTEWFENHWQNDFAFDISSLLEEVIEESWAVEPQPTPYHLRLKMAYELSRDARSGKSLAIPEKIEQDLLPWQVDAVRIATRILKVRGLAVVGDVVGLGKTMVGVGIAASLSEPVLVLCPPNLVEMWEEYLSDYDVPHRVFGLSQPLIGVLPELRSYKTVIIDEAHNLRHSSIKIWPVVKQYISDNDSKLILLTATMYNAEVLDISGQLELKLDPDADLGIQPEKHIESLSPEKLQDFKLALNHELTTLKAFKKSQIADDWRRLLSLFLVRRTRAYLLERYAETDEKGEKYFTFTDGREFRFPKRVQVPLEYPGGPQDPGDNLASVQNFDVLDKLTYARYQLGRYIEKTIDPIDKDEANLIEDLERATASSGFIRTTLLKRLASSPKAFFITVEKTLLRTHLLRWAAENNHPLPVGDLLDKHYGITDEDQISDFMEAGDSDDSMALISNEKMDGSWAKGLDTEDWNLKAAAAYQNLLASSPKKLRWARPELFDRQRLVRDLESDVRDLQGVIDTHGAWNADLDSKLQALANRIKDLKVDEKLLVFSEYSDSIEYIHRHLKRLLPEVEIGMVSGKSSDPTHFARRFSPKSNANLKGLPKGSTELQVLLATDVLSEGQNLQDCDQVLNWDIPWTIIKIIQRAGRVDRVGQASKEIRILTFKPHDGLDNMLSLVKRLRTRLIENHEIFGGGDGFFNDPIEDDPESVFSGGDAKLPEIESEVDFASFALQIWDSASEADRAIARRIGDSSFTTIPNSSEPLSGSILAHAIAERDDETIIDYIAYQPLRGPAQSKTPMEALTMTSVTSQIASADLLSHHLEVVQSLRNDRFTSLAQTEKSMGYVGIRGKLKSFLEDCQDKAEASSQEFEIASRLEAELSGRGIRSGFRTTLLEIMRSARKSKNFGAALNMLNEANYDGEIFTTAPAEVRSLKISSSFGWN